MKRLHSLLLLLIVALTANAQIVKIVPQFNVGDDLYYLGTIVVETTEKKVITDYIQRIKIVSKDNSSYTIETEILDANVKYKTWDYDADLLSTIYKARKGITFRFKTDLNGCIVKLLNGEEAAKKAKDNLEEAWDIVFWGKYPDRFENAQQQLELRATVFSVFSEQGFIIWMQSEPNLFSLFGKELKEGDYKYINLQYGLEVKNEVYSLSYDEKQQLHVKLYTHLDLTQAERKLRLLNFLKKQYPNDNSIESRIDELFELSQIGKLEISQMSSYCLNTRFIPVEIGFVGNTNQAETTYLYTLIEKSEVKKYIPLR